MKSVAAGIMRIALLFTGSAILLCSCEGSEKADTSAADETLMTEYSEDLSIVNSKNGRRSYHFETPLLEGYSLASEPYREFRKGIRMTTFKDDSLSTVDVVLTANYAIHYEKRKLWEARGDVVVEKSDGKTLYTQQLFWNELTHKIYSNVDSKIVQNEGRDVFIGEGFESDEEFKDWRFRRMKGRMEVEMKPTDNPDSLAGERPRPRPEPAPAPADALPADAPRVARIRPETALEAEPLPATHEAPLPAVREPLNPSRKLDSVKLRRTEPLPQPGK